MILCIETSTPNASLALRDPDSGELAWKEAFTTDRAHNAVIFSPLEEMLGMYRSKLSGIVVGLGPGSYSGIRVGIAVANGLALALGIPARGASSLEAWDVESDSHLILGDARRGSYFIAEIDRSRLVGEPELMEAEMIESHLAPARDRGIRQYTSDRKVAERIRGVDLAFPSAERLPITPTCDWPDPEPLEPHYLRAPYITTPKKRAR